MNFSFVIPSYNRKKEIEECIQSIEKAYLFSERPEIEILVVFCAVDINKNSLNLRVPELTKTYYLKENVVSKAKNIGIKMAQGKYIILVDDDAILKEDFLHVLNNLIRMNLKVFCALIKDLKTGKCFTDTEGSLSRKYLGRLDYNLFRGSAVVIDRETINRVGNFSEEFGPGGFFYSAEESDLFFRIKMQKETVLFAPELTIYHPICKETEKDKVFRYSVATGAVLTKYCFIDLVNMPVYLYLLSKVSLVCWVRIIQTLIFPKRMFLKNEQHRYLYVLKGMIYGITQYLYCRMTGK